MKPDEFQSRLEKIVIGNNGPVRFENYRRGASFLNLPAHAMRNGQLIEAWNEARIDLDVPPKGP